MGQCGPSRRVDCPSWLRVYGGQSRVRKPLCVALLLALVALRLHPALMAGCVILPLAFLSLA